LDAADGDNIYWQQARYSPIVVRGAGQGETKVVLQDSCPEFTNRSNPKAVFWFWMQGQQSDQPNANCNQVDMCHLEEWASSPSVR
jgi:hypothetical protein